MSDRRQERRARIAALSVALVVGFAVAGLAEDAPADGQTPPVPDKGTTSQLNCVDQKSEYTKDAKGIFYVQTFANKCEARLTCKVFAYVLNSRGPSHGHATLVLAPKSAGEAATKRYALKVKGVGGFGTSDRECRVF
jgi:hypothetical protein